MMNESVCTSVKTMTVIKVTIINEKQAVDEYWSLDGHFLASHPWPKAQSGLDFCAAKTDHYVNPNEGKEEPHPLPTEKRTPMDVCAITFQDGKEYPSL